MLSSDSFSQLGIQCQFQTSTARLCLLRWQEFIFVGFVFWASLTGARLVLGGTAAGGDVSAAPRPAEVQAIKEQEEGVCQECQRKSSRHLTHLDAFSSLIKKLL